MAKKLYFQKGTSAPTFVLKKQHPEPSPQSIVQPLAVSRDEAAKMLRISVPSLDRLAKEGKISPSHLGRSVRYSVTELEAFLERTKVNPE